MSYVDASLPEGARRVRLDVPGGHLTAAVLEPPVPDPSVPDPSVPDPSVPGPSVPGSSTPEPSAPRGTVLLVPGFGGGKEDFTPLMPALVAGGWRTVALDLRGQYESPGGSAQPDDFGLDALARDLLAVAAGCQRPCHLVGHSFGGLVSRRAVLLDPQAFDSLVLLGSGPAALTGPRAELLAFLPALLADGGTATLADATEAVLVEDSFGRPLSTPVRAFARVRWETASPTGLEVMSQALLTEPDRVEELRRTGLRVLVAHGDTDDAWLPSVQTEMAARLGAAHAVFAGAAHSPAVEQPEATAQALLAFWG